MMSIVQQLSNYFLMTLCLLFAPEDSKTFNIDQIDINNGYVRTLYVQKTGKNYKIYEKPNLKSELFNIKSAETPDFTYLVLKDNKIIEKIDFSQLKNKKFVFTKNNKTNDLFLNNTVFRLVATPKAFYILYHKTKQIFIIHENYQNKKFNFSNH